MLFKNRYIMSIINSHLIKIAESYCRHTEYFAEKSEAFIQKMYRSMAFSIKQISN